MEKVYLEKRFAGNPGTIAKVTKIENANIFDAFKSGFFIYEYNVDGKLKEKFHVASKYQKNIDLLFLEEARREYKQNENYINILKTKLSSKLYDKNKLVKRMVYASVILTLGVISSITSLMIIKNEILTYIMLYISSASAIFLVDNTRYYIKAKKELEKLNVIDQHNKLGIVIADLQSKLEKQKQVNRRKKNNTKITEDKDKVIDLEKKKSLKKLLGG